MLLEQDGERAFGQPAGGGEGDPFQGRQVGVEAGAGVSEGVSGHDFAPSGGQIVDILEFFGSELRSGHALSFLGLALSEGATCSNR